MKRELESLALLVFGVINFYGISESFSACILLIHTSSKIANRRDTLGDSEAVAFFV